jgi:hypothetical protein
VSEVAPPPPPAPPPTPAPLLEANVEIPLFGPEDVSGLDARAVCRVWPRADVMDAEANFFPLIEFSDDDLPWRYTPIGEDGGRLQPWIALIVLAESEFELHPTSGDRPLPVLVPNAAAPFPRPDQLWAWAHGHVPLAQVGVTRPDNESATEQVRREPERALARLLAPRRLRPRTAYVAFLVPTFERGRLAGLGRPIDGVSPTQSAWSVGTDGNVQVPAELPVYFQWRFGTGEEGDFQSLAERLTGREIPAGLGQRALDVDKPTSDLPKAIRDTVESVSVEAALRPWVDPSDTSWSPAWAAIGAEDFYAPFRTLTASSLDEAVLRPPLYGEWHAARHALPNTLPEVHGWFAELNADPRTRIAASLGTEVVQTLQEPLLASAWQQAAGIRRINEELRFNQLARQASTTIYHRDLATTDPDVFFRLTAPVLPQVLAGGVTAQTLFAQSPIPTGVLQGTWRRLIRSRGPSRRRALRAAGGATRQPLLQRLNDRTIAAAFPPTTSPEVGTPVSMMALLEASDSTSEPAAGAMQHMAWKSSFAGMLLVSATALPPGGDASWIRGPWRQLRMNVAAGTPPNDPELIAGVFRDAPPAPEFELAPRLRFNAEGLLPGQKKLKEGRRDGEDNGLARAMRSAFGELARQLSHVAPPEPDRPPVDLDDLRDVVWSALDPERTFAEAIRARLRLAPGQPRNASDPLEPVMVYPEFPQPMYEPLRERSPEWILPGLDKVQQDTVLLLQTNRRFIRSYMVGLSHEMARELLWNEYPTDQRGTYFRQFWRPRTRLKPPAEPPRDTRDITPIHTWKASSEGLQDDVPDSLVLLLRSELLRRYPSAMVYATHTQSATITIEHHPAFTGTMNPDVTFVGFEMPLQEVLADRDRWAFVIQEQPTEPRFGLDDVPSRSVQGYLDLTNTDHQNLSARRVLSGDGVTVEARDNGPITASATAARRLFQQPRRVLMRAAVLLRQMGLTS